MMERGRISNSSILGGLFGLMASGTVGLVVGIILLVIGIVLFALIGSFVSGLIEATVGWSGLAILLIFGFMVWMLWSLGLREPIMGILWLFLALVTFLGHQLGAISILPLSIRPLDLTGPLAATDPTVLLLLTCFIMFAIGSIALLREGGGRDERGA
ncbi:MAG: hypothetical protein QXN33_00195 [Candidatus Bathyarchaeia archaeon]